MRMEEDRSHMTEKIIKLTLEIIYLLTGEDYVVVKKSSGEPISGGWSRAQSPTMVPPPPSPIPERSKEQKILELTTMMVHLLTGESGNLRDPKVEIKEKIKEEDDEDGGMEEEHKDLYQDTMGESSRYRNPPERCPRPLYSTQEGHTIPHYYKSGDPMDIEFEVKSEEEERYVRDDQQSMEEDGITGTFIEEDTPTEISTGGSLTLNPFLHPYCSLIGPE
ncbi:uncharacterized protein LOC143955905 [Lithobates pipiens]